MQHLVSVRSTVVLGILGSALAAGGALAQDDSSGLEEIVVTAQRRAEKLFDVPISVSAFSQEKLDVQGVRAIDDIARLTPGVIFTRADARNGAASNISIRGISSTAGASTTGLYIDDTPIQIRSLGYSSFNTFPQVFDVERVEVLRGPQGTLFGAGSEGGTVRFITPQPSLSDTSAYVRSEVGYTEGGDPSYEAGAAFGSPIVADKLAFRVSAWYRRDGGWVDRTDWSRATLSPTNDVDSNSNRGDTTVVKAALTYAPTENLRITPSVYYQNQELNDVPAYWEVLSDTGEGEFKSGNAITAPSKDRFYLPALKVEWDFDAVSLVSNTSYFNRENKATNDYTAFEASIWARNPYYPVGMFAPSFQANWQNNITHEVRLQSNDEAARLNWVLGAFYSHSRQTASQRVQDTFLPGLLANVGLSMQQLFGQGLLDGLYTSVNEPLISRDDQIALFGQGDFKVTDRLTVTAGLRASKTKMEAYGKFRGPVAGPDVEDSGSQEEEPITPKLGVSYKFNEDNMAYATAAKGFRIGGFNPRVGLPCNAQLAQLGLSGTPSLYDSDSVWSYEMGSKNALGDNRVRLSSSLFYIDWSNIQQTVGLGQCGFQFIANLGSATSKGGDIQIELEAADNLVLALSVGYTDAEFDEDVKGGPGATSNLVSKGDHIVGSPWTGAASAQYSFIVGEHDGYARVDYQYQSRQNDVVAVNNPRNGSFNPNIVFEQPQTNLLAVRLGATWTGLDVSLFVNNALDSDTSLSRSATPGAVANYQVTSFRPRTFGVTASYRY
jgi:iron complex outermembrane receptor protein